MSKNRPLTGLNTEKTWRSVFGRDVADHKQREGSLSDSYVCECLAKEGNAGKHL